MIPIGRASTAVLVAAILILFFGAGLVDRTFCDVTKELKKLSEEREKSVGYAKIAKVSFKKQQKKLTQAMLYYTDAKAIGNPMIQQLQTSLTSRSMKETQLREMLNEDVKRLVTVNEKFRAFIESGTRPTGRCPDLPPWPGWRAPSPMPA